MFTGLIEDIGTFAGRQRSEKGWKLDVQTALPFDSIQLGDSIAVNGTCLTAEELNPQGKILSFHTLEETLKRTCLGKLSEGTEVNLERAMAADGRFGGHMVSGHIDEASEILSIRESAGDVVVTIRLPKTLVPLTIPKGSIAINGVSLTIADLGAEFFSVYIIPHTLQQTSLRSAKAGDLVNLEADMVGKYILRQSQMQKSTRSNITMNSLDRAGFFENE